jgi:hypothetical protein
MQVFIVNEKSGEIHKAERSEEALLTAEQCNVDDIEHWVEVSEEEALRLLKIEGQYDRCGNCWHDKD